jgi:branched-chain amino acid transport system ATP-binding protein
MTTQSLVAPVLQFERVHAAYGVYRALFDVSFSVAPGTVKALLGSNGAGKSTLSRVATGLVPTTAGTVSIGGVDVTGREAFQIARMGVAHVPEGRGIFSDLSVEENLTLLFRQRAGKRRVGECLMRAYDTFPILKTRRRQRAGQLSGGQQRLLSLANVLVVPPALLIADELSLGLAPIVVDAVYDGLREIHRSGCALFVVEQQIDRVLDIASEALVLEHGAVVYEGPVSGALRAVEKVLAARGESRHLSPVASRPQPKGRPNERRSS